MAICKSKKIQFDTINTFLLNELIPKWATESCDILIDTGKIQHFDHLTKGEVFLYSLKEIRTTDPVLGKNVEIKNRNYGNNCHTYVYKHGVVLPLVDTDAIFWAIIYRE